MDAAPDFSEDVPPQGYAWWYVDAVSDDGEFGLTVIAFVGSVFSPYYAWSGRLDPLNHCSINVALYGRQHARWAMTERGRRQVDRGRTHFSVGPSSLRWENDGLIIDVNERATPLPRRMVGQIRVTPDVLNTRSFELDDAGRHVWRPIAPRARLALDFSQPGLSWRGDAYVDSNRGSEPLETGFRYWDWSRFPMADGSTAILYNTDPHKGRARQLAMLFTDRGAHELDASLTDHSLRPTIVFRNRRRTRADANASPHILKTFEDAPFYSRSLLQSQIGGQAVTGFHEGFSGPRFAALSTKLMLPFRMPRRTG